jgi:hypothetical protein
MVTRNKKIRYSLEVTRYEAEAEQGILIYLYNSSLFPFMRQVPDSPPTHPLGRYRMG